MSMIPKRYRTKLPPYWYENNEAVYHFEAVGQEVDYQKVRKEDLDRQMDIRTVTWGIVFWEYIFKVVPKSSDSIETRRARVISKFRKRNPFTPAEAKELTKVFLRPEGTDKITVTEDPDTGSFYIAVPLTAILNIESWVSDIHRRKRVPHTFVPQLTSEPIIEIEESITVNMKRYHTFGEFQLGMTFMKYENEVKL